MTPSEEKAYEESCKRLDTDFWKNLEWTYDGKRILKLLESTIGQQNICIVTSNNVTDNVSATNGKIQWLNKELPKYRDQFFIGVPKHFFAHPNALLIDDKDENVRDFLKAGGNAFLLPRQWNSLHEHYRSSINSLVNYIMQRNHK